MSYSTLYMQYRQEVFCYTFQLEIQDSTNIHVDHQAFYNMEGCDRENVSGMIIDRIEASVSQLTCVTSNICKLSSYDTVNCGNSRRKRDTTESNVGFTFKLTCDTTICKYIYYIIGMMDISSLCINVEICTCLFFCIVSLTLAIFLLKCMYYARRVSGHSSVF